MSRRNRERRKMTFSAILPKGSTINHKAAEFIGEMTFAQEVNDKLVAAITMYGDGTQKVVLQRGMAIVGETDSAATVPGGVAAFFFIMLSPTTYMKKERTWLIDPATVREGHADVYYKESEIMTKATNHVDYVEVMEMRPFQ